eukprot:1623530-Pleurochrysis_carterae.AAC.1
MRNAALEEQSPLDSRVRGAYTQLLRSCAGFAKLCFNLDSSLTTQELRQIMALLALGADTRIQPHAQASGAQLLSQYPAPASSPLGSKHPIGLSVRSRELTEGVPIGRMIRDCLMPVTVASTR